MLTLNDAQQPARQIRLGPLRWGVVEMAKYLVLSSFTGQPIKRFAAKPPDQAAVGRSLPESAGGRRNVRPAGGPHRRAFGYRRRTPPFQVMAAGSWSRSPPSAQGQSATQPVQPARGRLILGCNRSWRGSRRRMDV